MADRTLEDPGHLLYDASMNRRQRARVLSKRQYHTKSQNAKRLAGEKSQPRIKRKQTKKPKA